MPDNTMAKIKKYKRTNNHLQNIQTATTTPSADFDVRYNPFKRGISRIFKGVRVMVFNATFNNISVITWWSVLLVEETGVPVENH
jgi:hypothetical protein